MEGRVKCTLVQALRLCTGRTAHRGSRGIALPFHNRALEGAEGSASRPGRSLPPGKNRYLCTGGWVAPRTGLDICGKSRPPPGFDPRTVQPVASSYSDYATRPVEGRVEECIVLCREYGIGGDCDYVTEAMYCSTMHHPSCTGAQGLALTL